MSWFRRLFGLEDSDGPSGQELTQNKKDQGKRKSFPESPQSRESDGACGPQWHRDEVGVQRNSDYEALTRLRVSANQGNSDAQYNLGQLYETGKTVSQSYSEALRWYRLSANQGHSDATKWFRLAADQGNIEAQFQLGLMYATGEGVYKNYLDARKWFREAAVIFHILWTEKG